MPPAFGDLIPIVGMLTGIVMMVLIGVTVMKIAQGPIGQAIGRRIHGKSAVDPDVQAELADLREQVSSLEQRLVESEERLDFAERLLSSGGAVERGASGRPEQS
ncbi:MAG: hypothetical protein ACRENB_09410 [Gemmatimonadales bacterium]